MIKKRIRQMHLWLGLASGLLVFIIAITGALYAFQNEIKELTQPYRKVEIQQQAFLPPSEITAIATNALPEKHLHAVMYEGNARAAKAIFYSYEEHYYYIIYINQYTGEVLKVSNEYSGFFQFILDGHFNLWLPEEIGKPIVSSATLVFSIMCISGIILWWPRNKNGRRQRFSIKMNTKWRRKNYDLHNVLGFYVSILALVFAFTGLVWGFEWFRNTYYAAASGGDSYIEYSEPESIPSESMSSLPAIDRVWKLMQREYPTAEWIEIHIPETASSPVGANASPDRSVYWKTDYRYFDQYSMKELSVDHMWGRFANADGAEKLMRMNYDIHIGSVLGLPGKILAFFASLIIASLPVTGTLIWWGRRNKVRKQVSEKKLSVLSV